MSRACDALISPGKRDVLAGLGQQCALDAVHAPIDHVQMKKLVLLLLVACAACSGGAQTPKPQAGTSHAAMLRAHASSGQSGQGGQDARATPGTAGSTDTLARIHGLVGTPSCTSDAQCHSMALGSKPCGGAESYLAWSSATTSETELRALADSYKAERQAANKGRMSDCRALVDPGAVCRAGTCQPGEAAPVAR
jgi:hypothetical protein